MTFADFVGNRRVVDSLQRMLAADRIPHALLFAGQSGVGKFTLAGLFARSLNCHKGQGEICGECQVCRSLDQLRDLPALTRAAQDARGSASPEAIPLILRPHSSVCVLVPDGAFIRVSQMRFVVREAYTRPAGARRTVFIFDQAERLRFDFADTLLKVLEEPPEASTLILVTSAPYDLRPTIRSRCVPLFFAPLTHEETEVFLRRRRPDLSKKVRELAAAASAGSPGTALELDLERYLDSRQRALTLLRAAAGAQAPPENLFASTAALAGKEPWDDSQVPDARSEFQFSLDILYGLLRDIVHCKSGTPELGILNPDLRLELQQLGDRLSRAWLAEAVRYLDRIEGWQRRNINRQLALDAWAHELSRSA